MVQITRHAQERMAQRLEGANLRRRAGLALKYGLTRDDATGVIRDYLNARMYKQLDTKAVIHQGMTYIFKSDCLVTVYPVKFGYLKEAEYQERRARERRKGGQDR